jgi:hypothetical protein
MGSGGAVRIVSLLLAISSRPLWAKESYVQFQEFDWTPIIWVVGIIIAASILVFILKMVAGGKAKPKSSSKKKQEQAPEHDGFGERAEAMGFRFKESKLLIQIASKVAPHKPETLLNTANGREHLYKDLEKRARVRERQVAVIRDVQRKLENMRGRDIQERESKRIESNMPVWVVRKIGRSASDPDALGAPEEEGPELKPSQGRLVDIGEGGAAVKVEIEADAGDLVDLWSGDPNVLLSPTTAVVVQVKRDDDTDEHVCHVSFLDPPLSELRAALYEIEMRSQAA